MATATDGARKLAAAVVLPSHMYSDALAFLGACRSKKPVSRMSPASLVHWFGVWEIGVNIVARGQKKQQASTNGSAPPAFVDVKLNPEQRVEFAAWQYSDMELLGWLQELVNEGYRIGLSWSNEQQSYFASLTGRDGTGSNEGCCMTSFAGDARKALALAYYKHRYVCEGVWKAPDEEGLGDFG